MNKIVIQYQTYQVLINKNRLTEMNHQLPKIETPHNQTTQTRANTNARTKSKSRKFKENYEQGKDYLTIIKKHRVENS